MSNIFYLVLFEKNAGNRAAVKSMITEQNANIILQDKGNPTITRKEDDSQYKILTKRVFQYKNMDDSNTTFLVCDCEKLKT